MGSLSPEIEPRIEEGKVDEFLTPGDVSRWLKVSKPWPYVMVKRGLLPCYKLGGRPIRFKRSDIEEFLQQSRVEKKKKSNDDEGNQI